MSPGVKTLSFNFTRVSQTTDYQQQLATLVSIEADGQLQSCQQLPFTHTDEHGIVHSAERGRSKHRQVLQLLQMGTSDELWPFSALWTVRSSQEKLHLHCGYRAEQQVPVLCVVEMCTVALTDEVQQQQQVTVKVKVNFDTKALVSLIADKNLLDVLVDSEAHVEITEVRYVERREFALLKTFIPERNFSAYGSTQFELSSTIVSETAVWAVALAVSAAVLALVIIMVLLYFSGFFERTHVELSAETHEQTEDSIEEIDTEKTKSLEKDSS